MGLKITTKGSFKNMEKFAKSMLAKEEFQNLDRYGQRGVDALSNATPVESGQTAASWAYRIVRARGRVGIIWYNSHNEGGVNIAIILDLGHGTGTGGYVAGRHYINPAIQPIMDTIADEVWTKVVRA